MLQKPNSLTSYEKKHQMGNNNIYRQFKETINKIVISSYNEGTENGVFFNKQKEDGTSEIYVNDAIENKFSELVNEELHSMKYFVGFTGIGKTTSLRNFFKVFNRDVRFTDNEIIIYISFFNSNLQINDPQGSIEQEITKYFKRAIKLLIKNYSIPIDNKDENNFWKKFYDFIESNKVTELQTDEITPTTYSSIEEIKYFELIENIRKDNSLDYYSGLLKYIVKSFTKISRIIIIYDDIESKNELFHEHAIETARHIHACLSTLKGSNYFVKSIFSLRAYTFRSSMDRQLEARRENVQRDTIFKNDCPSLKKIFELRFKSIENITSSDESKRTDAQNCFMKILNKETFDCGKFLYSITDYNICDSMNLFAKILTNHNWIGKKEINNSGAFTLNDETYEFTSESIFNALAYGETLVYTDYNNNFIPNIMHNHKNGTDLLSLYVIRYMINNFLDSTYGLNYQSGFIISDKISYILGNNSEIKEKIDYIIEFLFDAGILLRSVYDIESRNGREIFRKYNRKYLLYLSPRGKELYEFLHQNSLLLELLRDDIYTDLNNNIKPTYMMNQKEKMLYLLEYLNQLLDLEKKYIQTSIKQIDKYIEFFGNDLITSYLLKGLSNSLEKYYKTKDNDYSDIKQKIDSLNKEMDDYILMLSNIGISFHRY